MSLFDKVTVKPWEHAGPAPDPDGPGTVQPAGRTGLYLFLGVVTSMFALFSVSHQMRMGYPDWKVLAEPGLLWVNTAVLILASVAMHWAVVASRSSRTAGIRGGLAVAGVLTIAFVIGQFFAWREMLSAGYYAMGNPSYAFFYLFTGVHALHLVGGLWFELRALSTALRAPDDERLPLRIGLCATYWHFLLGVWLLLFYLLLSS